MTENPDEPITATVEPEHADAFVSEHGSIEPEAVAAEHFTGRADSIVTIDLAPSFVKRVGRSNSMTHSPLRSRTRDCRHGEERSPS